MRKSLALAALLILAPGAGRAQEEGEEGTQEAPGLIGFRGFLLYYNAQGPLSFGAMTPKDLPPGAVPAGEVAANSCQHGVAVPLSASLQAASVSGAGGNGGYRKALENLLRLRPELKGIYDVKVDVHTFSLLGFYRRVCIEITARGFK